jgi:molecular chaperone DnaK
VTPTSGLSEEEVARFISEADRHRAEDVQKREWADLHNNADTLIYGAERAIEEFGPRLEAAAKISVQKEISSCRLLLESSKDLAAAREAVTRLETEAHKLFEALQGSGA